MATLLRDHPACLAAAHSQEGFRAGMAPRQQQRAGAMLTGKDDSDPRGWKQVGGCRHQVHG